MGSRVAGGPYALLAAGGPGSMQGESGKSQMAPQMALGHRVPRGNGPGVPGSPRTNPFKFTRGDRSSTTLCRRMPKSKEAQARATKALREKRAKLRRRWCASAPGAPHALPAAICLSDSRLLTVSAFFSPTSLSFRDLHYASATT